ncbi:MAG: DUF1870 family protein [Dermabacter sp.]|nr:DUF1870 family protein [Dermabacter sp.]
MNPPISAGELQAIREWLGLTTDALAAILDVNHRTYRAWESGRSRIPHALRERLELVEAMTETAVSELLAELTKMDAPTARVYRTDAEMHAARPGMKHLTARWWRHVVARAVQEVPGVAVVSAVDNRE